MLFRIPPLSWHLGPRALERITSPFPVWGICSLQSCLTTENALTLSSSVPLKSPWAERTKHRYSRFTVERPHGFSLQHVTLRDISSSWANLIERFSFLILKGKSVFFFPLYLSFWNRRMWALMERVPLSRQLLTFPSAPQGSFAWEELARCSSWWVRYLATSKTHQFWTFFRTQKFCFLPFGIPVSLLIFYLLFLKPLYIYIHIYL